MWNKYLQFNQYCQLWTKRSPQLRLAGGGILVSSLWEGWRGKVEGWSVLWYGLGGAFEVKSGHCPGGRGRDGEQEGSDGTRRPGTYSGHRTLGIDTISSCHFESLRKAHIDAPGFIIKSHHFSCCFTWLLPFLSGLIFCFSLGQTFWEASVLTAYIIHLSTSYVKSIEK